ncbi:50S ribosomal protein L23 [candidate division TA06 bacterium DG_26]|uniref:Large ribosomal subunit protein uL23 n=1 Tax=candidate division TA06 bacterium DG_26 TaxID=1703771 RepID=A0A0S7WK45_UNCT6|nr:MAG: 50S ribosomal protein L23 [candidate division TA06 bacterium DG_26]
MNPRAIIFEPVITEKATKLKEENKYLFKVHKTAGKLQIKKAVEEIFKVKVESVNTQRVKGKRKRLGRFEGRRPDWKKALVKLREGKIELFEGL